jgi:hypothetical protein
VVHIVLGAGVAPVGAAFFFFFLFFFGGPLALTWTAAHATGAASAAPFHLSYFPGGTSPFVIEWS